MKKLLYVLLVIVLAYGCGRKEDTNQAEEDQSTPTDAPNTLSEAEKNEGWRLLFDGLTTDAWRLYGKSERSPSWRIADGALFFDKSVPKDVSQNIVTVDEFESFELILEWKIDSCGNSGIMFNVVDDGTIREPYETGPEMQVLDNTCHPDAKIIKHRAGDLYDMISCSTEVVKPAGEWNQVRIRSDKGQVEFWLNETKVVEFTMFTPQWDEMIKKSKFKEWPGFGQARKGRISLQDHGDNVWYRNIKIKELK